MIIRSDTHRHIQKHALYFCKIRKPSEMAETAGLAIGAISLLSLAATCADAYRLRTALRDYQSDGSALLMKIDIERARFYVCLKGLGIVEAKLDEQLLLEPGIIQLVMKVLYQIQGCTTYLLISVSLRLTSGSLVLIVRIPFIRNTKGNR